MTVRKYRSIEEMPDEVWHEPGSAKLFAALRATWARASRLAPRRFPPGVYKHRSLAAAQELKERWARDNFERHWRRLRADADD